MVGQKTVNLPLRTVNLLTKEFNIGEHELDSFIAAVIERLVEEHSTKNNAEVFTGAEIKEIEDNLKGLGYI